VDTARSGPLRVRTSRHTVTRGADNAACPRCGRSRQLALFGDELVCACPASSRQTRRRAYSAVQRALARGDLVKPCCCQQCGRRSTELQAHHPEGHSGRLALVVEWLDPGCHRAQHRRGLS